MSHNAILKDTFLSPVAHCQLNTETPNKLNLLHTLADMQSSHRGSSTVEISARFCGCDLNPHSQSVNKLHE